MRPRFRLVRPRFRLVGRLLETKARMLVRMKLRKASRILLVALPLRLEMTMGRRTLRLLVCACEGDGSRVVRAQEKAPDFFVDFERFHSLTGFELNGARFLFDAWLEKVDDRRVYRRGLETVAVTVRVPELAGYPPQ